MKKNALRLMVMFLFFMPFVAKAVVPEWKIIPSESQLTFSGVQNGAPVSGEFKTFTGKILVDFNDLKNSSIDIIIDINSLNTSYADLKNTLMTADWFHVKLFPKAEFKSTELLKVGEAYQAKGKLTMRDKSQPVTLNFTVEHLSANKVKVTGDTVLKRTLFGVGQGEWAGTKEIKDEVGVKFKVVGVKD